MQAMATASSFKQQAHELIDRLPESANWKDLVYEASIIQDIEEGLADSDAGRVTDNNAVRRQFGLPELPE
jgi:predicted transcriptional regulator